MSVVYLCDGRRTPIVGMQRMWSTVQIQGVGMKAKATEGWSLITVAQGVQPCGIGGRGFNTSSDTVPDLEILDGAALVDLALGSSSGMSPHIVASFHSVLGFFFPNGLASRGNLDLVGSGRPVCSMALLHDA
jgi:hypothetical protein